MSDIVDRARRNAKVIYIAVAESVADEISGVFVDCADEIDNLRAALATTQAERDAEKVALLELIGKQREEAFIAGATMRLCRHCGDVVVGGPTACSCSAALTEARRVLRKLRVAVTKAGRPVGADTAMIFSVEEWCALIDVLRGVDTVLAQEETR